MVLPESLLCVYEREYRFINSTVSKIDQKIVERFLAEGYYERHLNRCVHSIKVVNDYAFKCTETTSFHWLCQRRICGSSSCFSRFDDGRSEEDAVKKRSRVEYGFMDCRHFETQKMQRSCTILLGFANLPEEEIRAGAALLAENYWNDKRGGLLWQPPFVNWKRQMIKEKGKEKIGWK